MTTIINNRKIERITYVTADGTAVKGLDNIDMSTPITLHRAQALLTEAEELTGRTLASISIHDSAWDITGEPGIDGPAPQYGKRMIYNYCRKHNSLIIWEDGLPIYANDDGRICRDRDALADCML